jgi:hypothetical protein
MQSLRERSKINRWAHPEREWRGGAGKWRGGGELMNGRYSQQVKGRRSEEVRGGGFLSWGRRWPELGAVVS